MSSYRRVKQHKLSDFIVEQLESMILEGSLKPGDKLPPERELARQFEVSRPSLREAIQKLETKGLLQSRQGGGNYIAERLGGSLTDPLLDLLHSHPEFHYDLLEFRHALEGIAAYYAACRGTETDREIIRCRFDELQRLHEAGDHRHEAEADLRFHLSIAEAAHNVVLLHVMRRLFDVLQKSIVSSLEQLYTREQVRDVIPQQHRALRDAVLSRDGDAAREAAHDHIAFVEETLLELGREQTRVQRSLRRMHGADREY